MLIFSWDTSVPWRVSTALDGQGVSNRDIGQKQRNERAEKQYRHQPFLTDADIGYMWGDLFEHLLELLQSNLLLGD